MSEIKVMCIKNVLKHLMYEISEPTLIIGRIYTITHIDNEQFNNLDSNTMCWISEINTWVPIEFIVDLQEYREQQINKVL